MIRKKYQVNSAKILKWYKKKFSWTVINLCEQNAIFFFTVRDPSKLAKTSYVLNRCHDYTLQTKGQVLIHWSFAVHILLLLKDVGSARLRESDIHPISPKTQAPQYWHIDKKKRKEKIVENYCMDRAA